jgi:hypothetical protein
MLLLQRRDDGHHRFDKPRALCTLRPEAAFAPEDPWTDRSFSRVVRRFHVRMAHERPQRLPPLEDLPAHPFGLRHATDLSSLQQPLYLLPNPPHVGPKGGVRQRPLPDSMPPVEHLVGVGAQGRADLLGAPPAFDHGFNIPQQMRPTELPPPRGIPGIGAPAIRDQPPPELFPHELLGHLGTARQAHNKDGDPGSDGCPQPGSPGPFASPGLIQVRHRLLLHIRAPLPQAQPMPGPSPARGSPVCPN